MFRISIIFAIFIFTTLIMFYGILIYSKYFSISTIKTKKRLNELLNARGKEKIDVSIIKKEEITSILTVWLKKLDVEAAKNLQILILQSEVETTIEKFLIVTLGLLFLSLIVFKFFIIGSLLFSIIPSLLIAYLPYFYISYKAKRRNQKFAVQLPEAVDFIARSLKSGHGISAAFGMVSENFKEPVGPEFKQVFDEINFGLPFNQALMNLATRNSNVDLNFFTVALIIQREAGGNLIELLTNLSSLIRERSKIHAKIRNLSAEGRLSGSILIAMPFILIMVLSIIKHEYIEMLWLDPLGKNMLATSFVMMLVGVFWIKKLVAIRV